MTNEQAIRALGIGDIPTYNEIQRAYKQRRALFAPKTHPGNHVAVEYSKKLTLARDTLIKVFDDNAPLPTDPETAPEEEYRIKAMKSATWAESQMRAARQNKNIAKCLFSGGALLIAAKIICALCLDNQDINDRLTGACMLFGVFGIPFALNAQLNVMDNIKSARNEIIYFKAYKKEYLNLLEFRSFFKQRY